MNHNQNTYTLVSVAVAVILIAPAAGHATPTETVRNDAPGHPCFMVRSNWNAAELPQPVCGLPTPTGAHEHSGVLRPGLDYTS